MQVMQAGFSAQLYLRSSKARCQKKIVDMAHNGSGVRDTARTLKIGINTVIRALKTRPGE